MSRKETFACPDCGTEFGSKWARTEHEKLCAVRQSSELRRVQEQLEWKRARIERSIHSSYSTAARCFTAYHDGNGEQGQRLHTWLGEDFDSTIRELQSLCDSLIQESKVHFPRLSKLRSDVALLVEQAQEIRAMLATLNRDFGKRP